MMIQTDNPLFSVFPQGYTNQRGEAVLATRPSEQQTIAWAHAYITSERARWATEELRRMAGTQADGTPQPLPTATQADVTPQPLPTATREQLAQFKKLHFATATFGGVFSYRRAASLERASGLLVLDIDDLPSTEEARRVQRLLAGDPSVQTALCFLSPKGRGVKWVVRVPRWAEAADFRETFRHVQRYVAFEHGIAVDPSGSDVCRACFLPYDPECYVETL